MEPVGAFPDGEWDCFRRMFGSEENDFTPQFPLLLHGDHDELNIVTPPTFSAGSENERMFYSLDAHNSNSHYISQESSYSSNCSGDTVFIAKPGSANYYFSYPDHVLADNACEYSMDEKFFASFVPSLADIVTGESVKDIGSDTWKNSESNKMEPIVFPTNQLQLKRKLDVPAEDNKINNRSENHKKKARVSKDFVLFHDQGQGCMKNTCFKKHQKHGSNDDAEETNAGSDGQSSSSNMSEDDNASKENSGGATSGSKSLNSNGKTRASRGSATDPQSLYARKRRERINERLRILQNLVPNGTKVSNNVGVILVSNFEVDISTMLEEAVNYVKFLQLQIKLLSSDDLWMYAPLAYNGLDIGLNLNLKNSEQVIGGLDLRTTWIAFGNHNHTISFYLVHPIVVVVAHFIDLGDYFVDRVLTLNLREQRGLVGVTVHKVRGELSRRFKEISRRNSTALILQSRMDCEDPLEEEYQNEGKGTL
ncbi:hypothetical protein Fmac_032341 [Flemingia macrophylla]|uniref:BHLH domain-containing protein n=1 Tax=Flemingia macrophylla TaxID=520843 RepID=A0ABD1L4L5_9FABA